MKKFILIALVLILLVVKIITDTTTLKINSVSIQTDKLTADQKLTILQISDVHNRDLAKKYDRLLELKPDVIVLTGDLIDRKTTDLTNTRYLLEQLTRLERPLYFVAGNHEHESLIFEDLRHMLAEFGVTELNNQHEVIEVAGIAVNLVGVANHSTGYADLAVALNEVDLVKPIILLSHSIMIPEAELDVILSGHTHGGQVRLPFIGAVVAPEQGFLPTYDKGVFELESGATLYIDSGVGTSFLPIRLMNKAQVTMVTIH